MNRSAAEALARDVLRDMASFAAVASAVASLPELRGTPADQQTARVRTFKTNPPVQVLATFDASGQAVARSDENR
ncbi:MAG: hypothetical protein LC797_21270 [Chloroflexi bacterium]|nr:hypothetical protein [Chloroflexota bacterium]